MKVAGVVKFKHGGIWKALKKLGWSQCELARRSGLWPNQIGFVINMKRRPSLDIAMRIEVAFGEAGEYVDILSEWPEDFSMGTKGEISIYREITRDQLSSSDPQQALEQKEMAENALSRCSAEERELLELHYLEGWTHKEIADQQGCTNSNIGQKINNALIKIRNHPNGSSKYLRAVTQGGWRRMREEVMREERAAKRRRWMW